MALALLFPLSVHAGSYLGPVYSGGTYYGKGTDGTTTGVKTWPDKPLTATVKGTSYTGWGGYGIASKPASALATGVLTSTFPWQPAAGQTQATDPPPTQVIVTEAASARASSTAIPALPHSTASCSDGLGPAAVITTVEDPNSTPPAYSSTSGSCEDVLCTAQTGGATVTLTSTA